MRRQGAELRQLTRTGTRPALARSPEDASSSRTPEHCSGLPGRRTETGLSPIGPYVVKPSRRSFVQRACRPTRSAQLNLTPFVSAKDGKPQHLGFMNEWLHLRYKSLMPVASATATSTPSTITSRTFTTAAATYTRSSCCPAACLRAPERLHEDVPKRGSASTSTKRDSHARRRVRAGGREIEPTLPQVAGRARSVDQDVPGPRWSCCGLPLRVSVRFQGAPIRAHRLVPRRASARPCWSVPRTAAGLVAAGRISSQQSPVGAVTTMLTTLARWELVVRGAAMDGSCGWATGVRLARLGGAEWRECWPGTSQATNATVRTAAPTSATVLRPGSLGPRAGPVGLHAQAASSPQSGHFWRNRDTSLRWRTIVRRTG